MGIDPHTVITAITVFVVVWSVVAVGLAMWAITSTLRARRIPAPVLRREPCPCDTPWCASGKPARGNTLVTS